MQIPLQNRLFGSKIKIPKNMSKSFLQVIYSCSVQKKRWKKHQIFDKWDHFENQQSCKAYSLCKLVTLGQKLKFQTACKNLFYKRFTVILCKKPVEKTPNTREMRLFWKSAIMQTYSLCKIVALGKKWKFQNTCQNLFLQVNYSCSGKKPLEEKPNTVKEVKIASLIFHLQVQISLV